MAKLKHTFVRGRMNKDIDERMVPNGEYRDALNIQVATSEGSNVGAIENILGNTKKNIKAGTTEWDLGFGLTNPVCIGGTRDAQNDKIYWFITSDSVDAILEYDKATNIVAPILVDKQGVLNFSANYLITGINILDGLLYWTDDLNEPKVINIATFKAGSDQGANTDLSVHTQVYGRDFIEKDTTVITEVPVNTLSAVPYASLVGGAGTGITPITTNAAPGTAFAGAEPGDIVTISWSSSGSFITWPAGSRAVFNGEIEQEDGSIDKYQVVGEFASGISSATSGSVTIESATENIPSQSIEWEMLLIEDDPIFKNDFPRFSYRYKFTDGRYSTYAPFTLAAFVSGEFKYLSRDGNNKGMESAIRKIAISNFPSLPDNVIELELLYKGAVSNNIYVVETFESTNVPTTFDITSGLLGPVIESNQILRLFDNVPRKAKSQEVISNRIVYGNYLQNYTVNEGSFSIQADSVQLPHTNVGYGIPSVKTDREYQIGVSFLDEFGRESPVFTSKGGGVSVNKSDAEKVNRLEITLPTASIPSWAAYYKYYIKDPSPEYYNIALDRYYEAPDGGVWLSFPSAERNKLQEGKYITLKKEHDSSTPIKENNKYKILNISNEAPETIARLKSIKAKATTLTILEAAKGFVIGDNVISFLGPKKDENETFFEGFSGETYLAFQNSAGSGQTDYYKVKDGGPTKGIQTVDGEDWAVYEVTLQEGLKTNETWLTNLDPSQTNPSSTNAPNNEFKIALFKNEKLGYAEFQGRFFAKINPNATFTDGVSAALSVPEKQYLLDRTISIDETAANAANDQFFVYWDTILTYQATLDPGFFPMPNSNEFKLGSADWLWNDNAQEGNTKYRNLSKLAVNSVFKFKYADGTESANFYTIVNVNTGGMTLRTVGGVNIIERVSEYFMDRDFDDTQYGGNPTRAQVTGIRLYREKVIGDQDLLSSQNPAIFETEPDELADLDIYWEVSDLIDISSRPPSPYYLNWYNCYSFGNGVESDRIRDDFNAPMIGKGVRVNAELKEPYKEERRKAGLIYSGIYNNLAGINETNQFIAGLKITKDLDPVYGGIQKLFARDTNLLAFAEDKVYAVLADKDALFNADGNANLLSTNRVLGNASTFAGEFGISKNPESFASYGFRVYFTDKARGAVLRLSNDGITEISEKGMTDFFVDAFAANTTPVIGSFDESTSAYNIKLNNESVSYKERVDGWPTRLSFDPEFAVSLNNEYYTFKNGEIWEHSNETRNNFYGSQKSSQVTVVFNDAPSSIKNFKTLSYEGTDRWTAAIATDKQNGTISTWRDNEGIYHNFIKGDLVTWDNVTQTGNIDSKEFSVQGIGTISTITPGVPYLIQAADAVNTSLSIGDTVYIKRGTNILKVGDVVSISAPRIEFNDPSNIAPQVGEYAFFLKSNQINTSGLLGYYANVTFTNTDTDFAELFAINSEVFISSE